MSVTGPDPFAPGLGILLQSVLGALPVARKLQHAKVPSGTILSFVLVAPVLGSFYCLWPKPYRRGHTRLLCHRNVRCFGWNRRLWNRLISSKYDTDSTKKEKVLDTVLPKLAVAGDAAAQVLWALSLIWTGAVAVGPGGVPASRRVANGINS